MSLKLDAFNKLQLRDDVPDIRPGDTVRVHQKIKEKNKERIQVFEGIVIAHKHGRGIMGTITVRKIISGIGVERVFPLHTPMVVKMEIMKRAKVRRAKLYYLREVKGKKARLKRKDFTEAIAPKEKPQPAEQAPEEQKPEEAKKEKE